METISIIAHRGNGPTSLLSGDGHVVPDTMAPENTIKSFREAVRQGADGIEFDVYLSKNGEPVVIHDDELNKNVEGAARTEKDLGKVSEKSISELKAYNVGQGEPIPTLREALDFFVEANRERQKEGKPSLIMNIELKGANSWRNTAEICRDYVQRGLLMGKDFVFCSFKHGDLANLKASNPDFQIAPCLKTAFLFGDDNLIMPGWRVKEGATYDPSSLHKLREFHKAHTCVALDPVLWDAYKPLLDLAKELDLQLHISTSDIRTFDRNHLVTLLAMERTGVKICFKTDEPAKVREALQELREVYASASNDVVITSMDTVANTPVIKANTIAIEPQEDWVHQALLQPPPRPTPHSQVVRRALLKQDPTVVV